MYYANTCLGWINKAITRSLIKEGSGLFSKMRAYEEGYGKLALENMQLKKEKIRLQKEIARLKKLNEALDKTLNRFGKAGNVSDVSGDEGG
jgi:transposase-like protein